MTKSAAKSKAGYIVYFPGEPLRKVAHRSVSSSKTVLPLKRQRVVARKSSPPRKLTLKKKPTSRWSSNDCVSLSVSEEDCNNHNQTTADSDCSSSGSCSSLSYYSTGASNHPPTQPTVYVLCKLVDGVLVRV